MQLQSKSQPRLCRRRQPYFKFLFKSKYRRISKIIMKKKNEEILILSDINSYYKAYILITTTPIINNVWYRKGIDR